MSGASLELALAMMVFALVALVALFAEPVAGALSRFFSRYPLINLTSERQHRLRPVVVRVGALVMIAALYISQNLR